MAQRILALRKNEKNEGLYNDLFKTKDMSIVSSSPKVFSAIHKDDFGDEFHISDAELDAYVEGFIDAVNEANVDTVITEYNKDSEVSFDDSGLDDDDIKLSLYRSFKSLYDKWISNSKIGDTSGYFFNNYGQNDDRSLFDHFNFVNRGGQDIGAKAVIDPDYLTTIADTNNGEGPTQPLYTLMANILSKNNFDFFPLPNYVRYTNDKEGEDRLKDMFRADSSKIETIASNPSFVCMYIGGNSRILDIPRNRCINNKINFDYDDDSFDIEDGTAIPKDISNGNGITAFKVRYGQESQSHFSSIELDQSEFKETQESLLVIDSLVKPKSDQTPTQTGKGNNIYDMFLTRGYTCGVTALGNAMIQPLMYFKLENVPMFRGSYLITNVTHTITPHKMDTVFKGTRQPFISTPIVEDPVSILDLILEQQETDSDGESKNLSDVQGIGVGDDYIVKVNSTPTTNEETKDFYVKLLEKFGAKPTDGNLVFINAWAQAEGGGATWNPFNSTLNINDATKYNSVGVRNYKTFEDGLEATYKTLNKTYYKKIIETLKVGIENQQEAYNYSVQWQKAPEGPLCIWVKGPKGCKNGGLPSNSYTANVLRFNVSGRNIPKPV